jgi:hypothetical protein
LSKKILLFWITSTGASRSGAAAATYLAKTADDFDIIGVREIRQRSAWFRTLVAQVGIGVGEVWPVNFSRP